MIMKKTLSLLLAVIMIAMTFTVFPIMANAVEVDAAASSVEPQNIYRVSDAVELKNAKETINSSGAGEYVIELTKDITSTIGGIDIKGTGITVTIIGNDHYLYCPTGQNVQAWYGATVILGDGKSELTLIGGDSGSEPGPVHIFGDYSVCYMNEKVTIKNNKCNSLLGGGVSVVSGTFIMNGGTIENCGIEGGSVCYGGGVAVYNGGYFEMNGGTIKNCYVESSPSDYGWQVPCVAGGGVFVNCASFVMNNGLIEGCTATNPDDSSSFDAVGGGVAVITSKKSVYTDHNSYGYLDSDFTMNGGVIKNCSADVKGGALAAGMAFADFDPMLTHAYVPHSGSSKPGIYLNGGSMIGNDASEGGAIFLNWIRPNISVNINNMLISSNTAYNGAGIEIYSYWTQAVIDGCTITDNIADNRGGGIDINNNDKNTNLKNTVITGNTSGVRGAGVSYSSHNSARLYISGANIIQNNTYNGKQNNLNILSQKPVYVNGDLTGSQIGLSDPTLWDDNKTDEDETAVSTNYLTSGFKDYNSEHPANYFTSDHETWSADFSDVNANEVRLTRGAEVNYYINNNDIAKESYDGDDKFTQYVTELAHTVRVGDKIEAFYAIPQHDTNYIFKGWYYDQENDNDTRPVQFGKDKYLPNKNIYAHWIKVEDVEKDENDKNIVPYQSGMYGGFDLAGVQIRKEMLDHNFDKVTPGGMRFITSLSMDVVNEINKIKPDNIEYGYVAATDEGWINYHKGYEKLQYVSKTANGINTLDPAEDKDFFGFAHNINCTSKQTNKNGVVRLDHQNYDKYLIYSLVINYEDSGDDESKDVLARPYIHYTDANGLERVAYSEYRGISNTLGGCYTNYTAVESMAASAN